MSKTQIYEAAMRQALGLALNGPAYGSNPQVGAVILDTAGDIIAQGWHMGSGTPHAETAALENAREKFGFKTKFPEGYSAVVTLEPCNHTGKTGPCTQALIDAGIETVVYASSDPGEQAGGGGKFLKKNGVEVVKGVLKTESDDQIRVWLKSNKQLAPFVTIKWASSLDGRTAASDGSSQWISGPESRADTHHRRSEVDAILVGTGTVIADDPELTARKPDGSYYEHQPLRVILGERDLETDLRVFNDRSETLVLKTNSIHGALAELWEHGVKHVWVEGGPTVASKFLKLGLANEIIIYLAPQLLGGEQTALKNIGVENISESVHLNIKEVKNLGPDIFIRAETAKRGK